MPPRITRSQNKNKSINDDENQEPVQTQKPPTKKQGRKRKDQQLVTPAPKNNNSKNQKQGVIEIVDDGDSEDEIQETVALVPNKRHQKETVNEVLDEDYDDMNDDDNEDDDYDDMNDDDSEENDYDDENEVQETLVEVPTKRRRKEAEVQEQLVAPATPAKCVARTTSPKNSTKNLNSNQRPASSSSVNKILESSDEDSVSGDANGVNIGRKPLAPITNNKNKNLNDTPRRSTPCAYTRFDANDDVFRPNTPKLLCSKTSFDNDFDDNIIRSTFCNVNNNVVRSNNTTIKSYNSTESTLPTPFREMGNVHQICSWLCENPDILLLAYNMYLSTQTPVANGFNFILPNFTSSSTLATGVLKQEDRVKDNRNFLEELKCLFLRVRNPKKSAFEDLVRQVFNCDLNSAGVEWLRAANKNFVDSRSKFLDCINETINTFKEKRVRENVYTPHSLQESEVISFIDEALTINILQRWLNATNMTELKAQNTLNILRRFVRKAFIINYESRNLEMTKKLDEITKDIAVPSRNGRNIANNLLL